MYKHILVPLDGSRLAEDVLGPVEALAGRLHSDVTLLHVLERHAPATVHGEPHLTSAEEAAAYLDEVAKRIQGRGIEVKVHVHHRGVTDVAAAIDSHAHEYSADLIAMCKHGRSGIRRWLVGSIAQQIMRGGSTAVLLRSSPHEKQPVANVPGDILVPLDLHHDSDVSLAAAATIGEAFGSQLHLLTVIPSLADARRAMPGARLMPLAAAESLRLEEEEALATLRSMVDTMAAKGIETEMMLRHGDPSAEILAGAEAVGAGLIVLTTHALTGFEAWYTGSTGYKVIAGATQTLLLLREL